MKNQRNLTISILILFVILYSCNKSSESFKVISASVDNLEYAKGINPDNFYFSWKMYSDRQNVKQTAYQILVAVEPDFSEKNIIWDSGKIESEQSILVQYKGQKPDDGTTYFWKVKAWNNHGNESDWSHVEQFITGLFAENDWDGAKWIAMDKLDPAKRIVPGIHLPGKSWSGKDFGFHKLPILRKEFQIKNGLKQALVFVSGLGQYEMQLNGKKVGDHFLAPGWTDYAETALYNTYDVTSMLNSGDNAMGFYVGNGFFIIPNNRYRKVMTAYGNPMMILKMKLVYDDGSTDVIVSDQSWKTTPGPITYSSIYGGETWDATLEQPGWDSPGFDDSFWQKVMLVNSPCKELLPEKDYPVKIEETLDVKSITKIIDLENTYLYDFGQNASGIFELSAKGNRGDSIKIIPAELLHENGQANQNATGRSHFYTYVLKGNGIEKWQPKFTYYGYRYIQVEGASPMSSPKDGIPEIVDLKMLHNRNSSPEVGQFNTSYELLNRIDTLIKWAIKSNFQSVLSDCPHREKLGWLEQTYLMGEGIHFNYDVYGLYCKIVDDMITAQTPDGLVPDIAPEYVEFVGGFRDSPEWGSAAVILPWLIYKWYGDPKPMEKAWSMMTKYVQYLEDKSENHILDYGLGDWFDLGPERPGVAQLTPLSLTATAIYFYDVKLLSQMAVVLQKESEIQKYSDWAATIKTAFNDKFYNPGTSIYSTGSQTAIAMPLVVGLVEERNRNKVVQTLVESIEKSGNALTAGDIGFHFLVRALADNGQGGLLYKMNARDDVPGYGFQLKKGATALTESWPALENVSNNHLMLGHIMEWFYGGLGGIGQTENSVGYKTVKIEPQIVKEISLTKAAFESPYGKIISNWQNIGGILNLKVEIPANSSAEIILPVEKNEKVFENSVPISSGKLFNVEQMERKVRIKTGSGSYHFQVKK